MSSSREQSRRSLSRHAADICQQFLHELIQERFRTPLSRHAASICRHPSSMTVHQEEFNVLTATMPQASVDISCMSLSQKGLKDLTAATPHISVDILPRRLPSRECSVRFRRYAVGTCRHHLHELISETLPRPLRCHAASVCQNSYTRLLSEKDSRRCNSLRFNELSSLFGRFVVGKEPRDD